MSIKELNANEMESVNGGMGGSSKALPAKEGYIVYQIEKGDNLTRIAKWYGTTVQAIKAANPGLIRDINDITAGYYIYIPKK